jgi:hypothetical protein
MRILLDGLCVVGLSERPTGAYELTPTAKT